MDTPSSRVVVITGANSGIGKAAAIRFASDGDHVVMACRDLQRSAPALQEVLQASGGSAELLELDISSFASIRRFAEAFTQRHPRLDVLIHNAGYFSHGITTYQTSPDGLELTFATNTFGPLLLTELLLDALAGSDDARVLTAGSTNINNFFDPKRAIEFDNLRGENRADRPYTVYKMYGDSKMGLLLLTYKMAEVWADRGIKAYCVMIPVVRVERAVLQKFSGWYRFIAPLVQYWNPFALTPAQMAEGYHRICTSSEYREVSGVFLDHTGRILERRPGPMNPLSILGELLRTRHAPPYAADPANIERMWSLAQEVIGPAR